MIYKGTFWIPNKENSKLNGILTVEKGNDFSLELFGIFETKLENHEIILGVVEGNKRVTLYNCISISETESEYSFSKKIISTVIFNEHFSNEICMNYIDFKFNGLEIWNSNFDFDNDKLKEIVKFDNNYSKLEYKIYNFIQETIGRKISNKRADSYIRITSKEYKNIDYWLKLLIEQQRFFSIITGLPVNIEKIKTHKKINSIEIYDQSFYHTYKGNEIDFLHNSYVKFQDFISEWKLYMENWNKLYDQLKPTFNLYYLIEFSENKTFVENEFLMLMQAIENFHKRKFSSKDILSENRKNSFIKFTNYSNLKRNNKTYSPSPNLWERIEYLVEEYWVNDMCNIFNSKDTLEEYLIDRATYYRNYLNHWDKAKEIAIEKYFGNNDKFTNDLILTERILREFLKTIILKELGIELNKYVDKIYNVFKYIE